jgi:DNA-binding transcriptional LysR family regulator
MNDFAEFRHFKYLLEVLVQESLRSAADHLHTTSPNLCKQAQEFQEHFHLRLYRKLRDNRITRTKTGTACIAIARGLLEHRDEAIAALQAIESGAINTLRLGSGTFVDKELFRAACELHREVLPSCVIKPEHADTSDLAKEIVSGEIHAAIVTLPVNESDLQVEELRRDRLVLCLRADHPLAGKPSVRPAELSGNIGVLYHPQRHPEAHEQMMDRLKRAGIRVGEFSSASHPTEIQQLVKEGYGLTLVREGTELDPDLTTRPIFGVDWTVDTAFIYHRERIPPTIPVLVRQLRRHIAISLKEKDPTETLGSPNLKNGGRKRPARSDGKDSAQLNLLDWKERA